MEKNKLCYVEENKICKEENIKFCWSEDKKEWFYDLPEERIKQNELIYKMLFRNQIPGLLPMGMQYVDSFARIYFSTGEMNSLEKQISSGKLSTSYGFDLLEKIMGVLKQGEQYFLEPSHYSFSPERIYVEPHSGNVHLCYYVEDTLSEREGVRELLEFLLERLDHKDREEIQLFYDIYESVSSHGFVVEEIMQCLRARKQRKETAKHDSGVEEKYKEVRTSLSLRLHKIKNKEIRKIQSRYCFLPQCLSLTKDRYVFGRGNHCDVSMPLMQISNRHFTLRVGVKGEVSIVDDDSRNGTYLNGVKLKPHSKTQVKPGDIISFGEIQYKIC